MRISDWSSDVCSSDLLIWKTTGAVQADAKRLARPLTPALLVAIAAVSAYTPFLEGQYYERWFASPGIFASVPMPLLVAGPGYLLWRPIGRTGAAGGRPREDGVCEEEEGGRHDSIG